jgi:hypothetical protein
MKEKEHKKKKKKNSLYLKSMHESMKVNLTLSEEALIK